VIALLQGRPLRHPLHPILIHFPIGLFVLSLVLDLLSVVLDGGGEYVQGSLYVMTAGVVTALLAAVAGLADLSSVRRDSRSWKVGLGHMILMIVGVSLFTLNLWLRWSPWGHAELPADARVEALGLLLSLLGLGAVSVGAYSGGRLVYGDGISVGRHRRSTRLPKKTIRVTSEGSPDGFAAVAADESLGEGETLRVELDGTVMTVVRLQGDLYAFGEFCTHRFGPMSEASFGDCRGECPWHRSEFDVRSGEVVQGPAKEPLRPFAVKVEGAEIKVSRGSA
jgi:uncharacterized membrane protein/nitrite reductase/ring-hydroxylating ferredoxin subunit